MIDDEFVDHIPAKIYQKVFGYRDVRTECDFLKAVSESITSQRPVKFLEIASGPSEHAILLGKGLNVSSHALDLSSEMIELAKTVAITEKSEVQFHHCDMVEFDLPDTDFDMAYCLIDSISYILTQSEFLRHLTSVAKVLKPGAVYVIETLHPKELFGNQRTTKTEWTTDLGDEGSLTISFGNNKDKVDPISQARPVLVEVIEDHPITGQRRFSSVVDMKIYLYQELLALIHQSEFLIADVFGGFDTEIAFDNSRQSWRCILALQVK